MTNFTWQWALRTQVHPQTYILTKSSLTILASTAPISGVHNPYRSLLWTLLMCQAVAGWCTWMMIWLFLQVVSVMQTQALSTASALHVQQTTELFSFSRLSAWVATKWFNTTWQETWVCKLLSLSQYAKTPIQKFYLHKVPLMVFSKISARNQYGPRSLLVSHSSQYQCWQFQYRFLSGAV